MLASIHSAKLTDTSAVFAVHAKAEQTELTRAQRLFGGSNYGGTLVFDCIDLKHAQALTEALREVCAFEVR